jgi:hypothetical protein
MQIFQRQVIAGAAVRGLEDLVTLGLQGEAQDLADAGGVVDEEDGRELRHLCSLAGSRAALHPLAR